MSKFADINTLAVPLNNFSISMFTENQIEFHELDTKNIIIQKTINFSTKVCSDNSSSSQESTSFPLSEEPKLEEYSTDHLIMKPSNNILKDIKTEPEYVSFSSSGSSTVSLNDAVDPNTGESTGISDFILEDKLKRIPIEKTTESKILNKSQKRKRDFVKRLFKRIKGRYMEPVQEVEDLEETDNYVATLVPKNTFRRASEDNENNNDNSTSKDYKSILPPNSVIGTDADPVFQKLFLSTSI